MGHQNDDGILANVSTLLITVGHFKVLIGSDRGRGRGMPRSPSMDLIRRIPHRRQMRLRRAESDVEIPVRAENIFAQNTGSGVRQAFPAG